MSSVSECKLDGDNYDGEVFHMIGASLYKQEQEVKQEFNQATNEVKQDSTLPEKPVMMNPPTKLVLIVFLIASVSTNLYQGYLHHYQIRQSTHWESMYIEHSKLHHIEKHLWEQKYQKEVHTRELLEMKVNFYEKEQNDTLLFDTCWLKAQLGDCAINLYEDTTRDLQHFSLDFNSINNDINIVSSEVYNITNSISSAVIDALSLVTTEIYKSATVLEYDINAAVSSLNDHAKNASEFIAENMSEGLKILGESFMEFV